MNKFLLFTLLFVVLLAYATGQNEGPKKKRFFSQCAQDNCSKEIEALKALKDNLGSKPQGEGKDRKEGGRFQHKNSTEMKNLRKCVNEKCPNDRPTTPSSE